MEKAVINAKNKLMDMVYNDISNNGEKQVISNHKSNSSDRQ
jgi:hypothetical protein